MNNWIKFTLIFALSLPMTIRTSDSYKKYSVGTRIQKMRSGLLETQKALATTTLDPANMNTGTVAGRADFIRFLYFLVVGPTAEYVIPNGPEGGLVGIIKNLMSEEGLGGGLYQMGYTTCASIPTSGSETINENGETIVISFATPAKTVPAHYGAHAGNSFEKSVSISFNAVPMLKVEFTCEADGLNSGYARLHSAEDDRDIEMYWLRDASEQDAYLDFYMTADGASSDEKAAVQFRTLDDNVYDLFLFRNEDGASVSGGAFGLKGDASTGLVKVHYQFDNDGTLDNTTAIGSAASECIDLSTNALGAGCGNIVAPSNFTVGTAFTWTIDSLNDMTLNSL
ncbi:hypothetical protein [Bdellovibrio reynosensis]|uniref:Uncharacterized protein n=1 Tax=Bdellovibrio reynosensis TaxID=2835041 RepID=A0ABY4C729_9BACT|nr:hypothetical protein [Bdellovibrio reynosensis]UOF00771.1 hypothetical protein MNR06_13795 [Bdellovibrio reynosensis]